MDSHDPGNGYYYTNLLNEDHQFDSSYVWQNEISPRTNEDSPPFPLNEEINIKKSVRGVNFTPEEDKLLVSAWLNCSVDAVQGTDQKHSQLWGKIFEYFQQYKETTNERTIKSLTHRWSVIQRATNKFCAKLAQVGQLNQSGMTEQDKFDKAKVMYQSLEKCSFQFEHCWHLLKNQPKWIWHATKADPKRRKTVSPAPSPSPTTTRCSAAMDNVINNAAMEDNVINNAVMEDNLINNAAMEDNVIKNDIIELDRPIGRKAEKRKRKALDKQVDDSVQLRKLKYTLLEESRVQEKEFYRLKAEKMEYEKEREEKKIRQEDERLRLECEKLELAKKDADQLIMMMDVKHMPEIQRLYFLQLQQEIMKRNG